MKKVFLIIGGITAMAVLAIFVMKRCAELYCGRHPPGVGLSKKESK